MSSPSNPWVKPQQAQPGLHPGHCRAFLPEPSLQTLWFLWDLESRACSLCVWPSELPGQHWPSLAMHFIDNNKATFEPGQDVWLLKSAPFQEWWQSTASPSNQQWNYFYYVWGRKNTRGNTGRALKQSKWWKWDQFMTSCFALIGDVWMYQEMK